MNKVKAIIFSLLYILLFLIINFGVVTIFTLYFNSITSVDLPNEIYIIKLADFFQEYQILAVLSCCLLWLPIIYKKMKKQRDAFNSKGLKRLFYWLLIVMSFSIVWNLLWNILEINVKYKFSSFFVILGTSILGPILEEFVFRGIIYAKLKLSFSKNLSIFLVSCFFSLSHLNIFQGLYAFIISLIVTNAYEKYHNIWMPIVLHCASNLTVSCLLPIFVIADYWVIWCYILICLLVFSLSLIIIKDTKN